MLLKKYLERLLLREKTWIRFVRTNYLTNIIQGHAPFFDEILKLHVRIAFQNTYYCAQIVGICEYPPYKMPDTGTITTKGLILRQHTQSKHFKMTWYTLFLIKSKLIIQGFQILLH